MAATTSTRERILVAAVDLFGTRGVDAVSLDEIARDVRMFVVPAMTAAG